jgi:hypothetical protein
VADLKRWAKDMKRIILLLAVLSTASGADDTREPTTIPGLVYIRDAKAFLSEDSKLIGADARRALNVAKAALAFRLKAEVEAKFSIAEAAWGYQVNFSSVRIEKGAGWEAVTEGFGEVFLSKMMDRIKIDYGP